MPGEPQIEETIKYVPVPVEKEVIVKVPKQQFVDRIVEVPRVEVEYVDRVVEVPRVNIVEKIVERIEYVDKLKHVPVRKEIEVPREVITYVPRVEVKVVEKEVEVPGQVIEVPKHVEVVHQKLVNKYVDHEVPTVVAQTWRPQVVESEDHVQTAKLKKYVPYLIPVEVLVPVAVDRNLIPTNETVQYTRTVEIPHAQFNAQLKNLNPELPEQDLMNLYRRNMDGSVTTFEGPGTTIVEPRQ